MHKKRLLLEKDLLIEIQKEVAVELSNKTQQEHLKQTEIKGKRK